MQQWLYEKECGYYSQNNIGKGGDFYTSVSVSKFFGAAIARFIFTLLETNQLTLPLYIVEIGSNSGDLISDIAEFIKAFNDEVFTQTTFCTLEPLQPLKELQEKTFALRIQKRFNATLQVYDTLESLNTFAKHNIFFLSNELFDSMPCDLIVENKMLYYHNNKFVWKSISQEIQKFCEKYHAHGAEISLTWESFIANLSQEITQKWIFLTFDYGDFQARDMNLRIYSKHKVYNFYEELQRNNIETFYQQSDITYDVDFSVLQNIFYEYGGKCEFCFTQAKTLIEKCNILEVFEIFASSFTPISLVKQKTSLQGLISPNAMGERFKALCVSSPH